ncbi:FAD-linked oxidase C-terminal domain-containing protein [Thermomonas flagellata]|uniref:FAD-linked oxidase C-terminal domain-containing protein n=1 Tax=Thermomonas flagellata TaxID=2888524 RepID=UPI001F03FE82
MPDAAFLARLRALLPADAVLTARADCIAYECDGLPMHRQVPDVVVLPRSEAEVAAVLRMCHAAGVPVVTRGAGTGLSGGALPVAGAVLLVLARMDRLLHLDPQARVAVVEPGVRNLAVSEAAAAHGLYYAPDPSSQIACSIGGNVAENAGGVHCLKYGLTVHNLLGLRALTCAGELLELGGLAPDAPGYDLRALLTGSEGMLAVVTQASLRLLPRPACTAVLLAAFDAVAAAGAAVGEIIAAGIVPAGLEMMDRLAIAAAEAYVGAGYPQAEALLLVELDGVEEEVEAAVAQVLAVLARCGARDCRRARDADERARFWAGRKAAFPAVGRLSPDYYCMDGSIPRAQLPRVLEGIAALAQAHGLRVANVFHAGDGNLHPLILYDASVPGQLRQAEALGARILELCIAAGGSITGEHGVGVEKLDQMCVQFDAAELECFHAIKAAFDPRGLLNPGKAVPTLRRCAEGGRMHVHAGSLPHPHLPRF